MITQNFDLLIDFDFYTPNIEEIKEKRNDFLENINKKHPENLDYIEEKDVFIDEKTEKEKSYLSKYEYEYKAKFKIKISCKANFVNYARFCIDLDSILKNTIDAFSVYGVDSINEKIILKEIIYEDKSYYD